MKHGKASNITKGTVGTYLAAGELVRQGFIVSALSQTAKGIDILAADPKTLRPLAIQESPRTRPIPATALCWLEPRAREGRMQRRDSSEPSMHRASSQAHEECEWKPAERGGFRKQMAIGHHSA